MCLEDLTDALYRRAPVVRINQDVVAMSCLELAHRNGHWVILNNIHLMPRWLIELEKKLDEFAIEKSHEKFRLYLSSDPSPAIPIGVLSRCIKLTNEPPAGLKANLKRAFTNFSRESIEEVCHTEKKHCSFFFGGGVIKRPNGADFASVFDKLVGYV